MTGIVANNINYKFSQFIAYLLEVLSFELPKVIRLCNLIQKGYVIILRHFYINILMVFSGYKDTNKYYPFKLIKAG